jgi:hypothetical protein
LRFGTAKKFTSISDFATWKKTQIDNNAFSEWSTVMLIKAISKPDIYIKNKQSAAQDVIATEQTESTLTPTFYGYCDLSNTEIVNKYCFILYEGKSISEKA